MKKYAFGVDVGGTTCKIGLFETSGRLIEKWEIKTNTRNGGEQILSDVAAFIEAKLTDIGIGREEVQGIGMGVPGPVREDGIVSLCVNLGWRERNVAKELQALTGFIVKVGNDANVAALGEMWQGSAKGCKNTVMVTLGTGVGGGVIVGGRIIPGFDGAGGEIGHISVCPEESEPCNCGRYGCLEQYVSATGIVRVTKRRLEGTDASTSLREIASDCLTAKDVFDAAKAGDVIALELVDEVCEILGLALSNMACVVNPEMIVIGGGVSGAGAILVDGIRKHFMAHAFTSCQKTKFSLAGLGNDAGIYGGVQMLLQDE